MTYRPSASVLAGLLALAVPSGLSAANNPPPPAVALAPSDYMRGMVVSCPWDGRSWGLPQMDDALAELRALGVEWAQLHPWGRIDADGTVRFRQLTAVPFLPAGAAKVRSAGMRLAWAPHLAWWGSFEWRGAIDFGEDEAAWSRFFGTYEAFVVDQARVASAVGAELFVVGLELEGTTRRETEWRRILAEVRKVYRGPVAYAANWDRLDRVPFWDAVDLIGVQAYFPVGNTTPTDDEIAASWRAHLAALDQLSQRVARPVYFNEVGYPRSREAASQPWKPDLASDPESIALRERLLRGAQRAIEGSGVVRGVFWWKWVVGDDSRDRDFSMREPEGVAVLRSSWGAPR